MTPRKLALLAGAALVAALATVGCIVPVESEYPPPPGYYPSYYYGYGYYRHGYHHGYYRHAHGHAYHHHGHGGRGAWRR
jgi:hypothetical protein